MDPLAFIRTGCAVLGMMLLAGGLPAAGQVWSVDTFAGRVDYTTLRAATDSASVGIRFNQDHRRFRAAVGVPLSGSDLTWGLVEGKDRFAWRRDRLEAGMDVSLAGHAYRDPGIETTGYDLLGELMPVVSRSVGAGMLEARSGFRWYGARFGGVDWSRAFWTTEFRGHADATTRLRLEGDVRHERGGEAETYTRTGFGFAALAGPVVVRGSVGAWVDGPPDTGAEWGGSVAFPIRSDLWMYTAAAHQTFNPHFLNPPRTSWGIGLSWQFGGPPMSARTSERIPEAGFETSTSGNVTIRLPLGESETAPFVAGDFNGWTPARMNRQGNQWSFATTLPPGVYYYAFRTADGEWFVPENAPNRTDDGMGGSVAVLVVR